MKRIVLTLMAVIFSTALVLPGISFAQKDVQTNAKFTTRLKLAIKDWRREKKELKEFKKEVKIPSRPCVVVPVEKLTVSDWLKDLVSERPVLLACRRLPPGLAKQLLQLEVAADATAPLLSAVNVSASATTASTAKVRWLSNEPATSNVYFGTTSPLDLKGNAVKIVSKSALVFKHNLELTGLTANTTYYLVVESTDKAGNTATSIEISFTTAAN